jgi:hypothetical protein
MMKRNNETNQGKVDSSAARGQTIRTPVGKDSSDWSGKASDEIPAKMKMRGGIDNYDAVMPPKRD